MPTRKDTDRDKDTSDARRSVADLIDGSGAMLTLRRVPRSLLERVLSAAADLEALPMPDGSVQIDERSWQRFVACTQVALLAGGIRARGVRPVEPQRASA
ncbi:MAG: hypothetical protein WD768_07765 [Phycisphaeraceae bacterium]